MMHSHGGKGAARLGGLLAVGSVVTLLALMMTHPSSARPVSGEGPVRHVVVIFQENISFDHYFATYPHAANTDGTAFTPRPGTPSVNGLNDSLLAPNNPNSVQPFRLSHEQAQTATRTTATQTSRKRSTAGSWIGSSSRSAGATAAPARIMGRAPASSWATTTGIR